MSSTRAVVADGAPGACVKGVLVARCSKGPENLSTFHSLSPRIKGLKTLLNGMDELFVSRKGMIIASCLVIFLYIYISKRIVE
jgi:hypothetical protein